MANSKSALKRVRQADGRNDSNKYYLKTARTFVKKLRGTTDKKEAADLLKKVSSMLDDLAKKNIIHKNKAANDKSKLARLVNSL